MICHQCGAANADQARFCMKCGAPLSGPAYPAAARPGRRSSVGLIILVIVIVGIGALGFMAILAAIAVPNFLEAQVRSKISRTRADLRSMATALEAYNIDNNAYPISTANLNPDSTTMPWPVGYTRGGPASLTSPIAYITNFPIDVFMESQGQTFAYWRPGDGADGWALFSAGPDEEYDLDWRAYAHDPATGALSARSLDAMINGIYDPTNGTVSDGDVVRFKM